MDADDVMLPGKLKKQCEFLIRNSDYGVVSGLVNYVSHKEGTEGFARFVNWVNSVQTHEQIVNKQFIEAPIVNPTAMWRKEIGLKLDLYKHGDFPEDYEMWLRWIQAGVKIHKLPEFVLDWYDSDTRLTRTDDIYSNKAFYTIKSKYLAEWLAKNNPYHPKVSVWGASSKSRKGVAFITVLGIEVDQYIDTKLTRQLDKGVILWKDIPKAGKMFILIYMKHDLRRKQIAEFLEDLNYKEGTNFLFVS